MSMIEDRKVQLRDGRALGYTEYGAPDGFVVIYTHGGLACRRDVSTGAGIAAQNGIRLLALDRPGIGLSDPKPGRTVAAWADDVAELRDQLAIDDFAAMGWSMGGQYALALGYAMPAAVTRVAVITGGLPITDSTLFAQMPTIDRVYIRMAQRAPWLARGCLRSMGFVAQLSPGLYGRLASRDLPAADAAVIRAEGFASFGQMSAEALRRSEGHVEDYLAAMRPWGFAPEDVAVPVDVWGGAQDEFLNPDWPATLASRIPGSSLHIRSGGHFMAHLHWQEIFDALHA
ncbi:alpha/beta fold hydrolase [Mycolicibacterium sp. P1-5]|uniref:alpha/beta fold hydrolase n=1 Tax=Mycolicibacterium sp. P1-5 TaxID=2024617 RepID=UPI0011F08C97|nr:alpha/beta hydrolase [Mycolicibacterium sp. P1-5]KAA0110661.1 alpha/beta hydrolase [Mycolicibacterium sp. P1-5]